MPLSCNAFEWYTLLSDPSAHEINSSQICQFAHSKIYKITHTNVKKTFPSEVTTKTRLWLGVL